jgi:tripartite-type tricarboxylate transporter receptor subunit TctC
MKRLLAGLLCAFLLGNVHAQYPDKPVRLIVPFPPGGGTDALGRILAAKLGELWGQQVIVENRAGAQGNIGTAAGAKAAPDGYTLTFAHQGALVINPHLYKDTGYDTLKDFAPVALATQMAFIAVAHPSVPANDLRELAQYAKKNPGKLSFASTSAGPHIVGELFKQATGTDLLHVPYKGAGPAITDLLGGQVNLMFSNPTSTVPHVRSGKLRALGVMDGKRNPTLPDVPTAQEQGFKGLDISAWNAIYMPKSATPQQVAKLNAALSKALDNPALKQRLEDIGLEVPAPARRTPEYLAKFTAEEIKRWEAPVKASGVQFD